MKYKNHLLHCFIFLSLTGFSQKPKIQEPELIFVQGGDFQMGCLDTNDKNCLSDEKPAINVKLYDYWISKYEVTNAQFAEFLSEKGNQIDGNHPWYVMDKYALIEALKSGMFISKKGFENYPVNNVSWYGARAYTKWLSKKTNKIYRLPTEAEWEYAAKGGKESQGFLYSGGNELEEIGWTFDSAVDSKVNWGIEDKAGTFPVGQKKPNELGIYDMTGNLSEWVFDVYDYKLIGGINPAGPNIGAQRIVRGGSWDHEDEEARNSARTRANPNSEFTTNKGFRVVMEKEYFSKIDTVAKKYDLSGVALIKKRDAIIYQKSFGINGHEQSAPMTNDTPFTIMSITKIFTSTIILQLIEEGKISLGETIFEYLPEYKGPGGSIVTIHQLLNHTSGIQAAEVVKEKDGETPSIYANIYSTDELLNIYCSGPLISKSGTKFDYSNADYIILGKIIEKIENDSYENVLNRRLLGPLQMSDSGLITNSNYEELNSKKQFPIGYTWDKKKEMLSKDEPVYVQNFFSSGAMYSTAADLAKFSDALFLDRSLLNESSMQKLLQTYPEGNQYGYGLWVRFKERGKQVIKLAQRPGKNLGINTMFTYVFDHDISIILFLNSDKISIDEMANFIQKQILEN